MKKKLEYYNFLREKYLKAIKSEDLKTLETYKSQFQRLFILQEYLKKKNLITNQNDL